MSYIGKTPTPAPLTSSDITDGIVSNSKLAQDIISAETELATAPADTDELLISDAGVLKRIDASLIGGGGITEADSWRITASYTSGSGSTTSFLTSNWERTDTFGFGQIGTGMTESSGIFSFPTTGVYFIKFNTSASATDGARDYIGAQIRTTTDNSNYNLAVLSYLSASAGNYYASPTVDFIFDVTNISTHKVKFGVQDPNPVGYEGDTNIDKTCVRFIRLGDT